MKKYIIYILLIVSLVSFVSPQSVFANMIYHGKTMYTKVFYSQGDIKGWKALIKGRVRSFSVDGRIKKNSLFENLKDRSRVTVRLYNKDGVKRGDTLYVINNRNLIVSKMKIRSIIKSEALGYLVTGTGNFKLARKDFYVVQKLQDEHSRYAYIYKSRGDYFYNTGKISEAIKEYKNAINVDRGNPEAHIALGNIYFKQGVFVFANMEYMQAYREKSRIYDNQDRFNLFEGLAKVRFNDVYFSSYAKVKKKIFIKEGIKYSKEALSVNRNSVLMNYYLGVFYYKSSLRDDKKARDYFLKVIKLDNKNINAYVFLSKLYFHHNNRKKAVLYASKALNLDPGNERLKTNLHRVETYNKSIVP